MTVLQSWLTKKFHSAVPIFGAILLGVGMLLIPTTRYWAWLAIPLDYGTLALIIASPRLFREPWNTRQYNLLHEYLGETENITARLRFFRRGIFTIRIHIKRQPGQTGLISAGTVGTWHLENEKLKLKSYDNHYAVFQLTKFPNSEFLQQESGFSCFETNQETSLVGMKLASVSKIPLASVQFCERT